jgi:predicted oxidoreductase
MITTEEKINIVINRLNNLDVIIQSFIANAEILKDKYSLSNELLNCDSKKEALMQVLTSLGGTLPGPLTNQG